MGEWVATTIGEAIAQFGGSIKTGPFGTVLRAAEYSNHGVPVISVGEVGYGALEIGSRTPRVNRTVLDRLPDYVLEAGDIVFGRKGAVDRSAWIKPQEAGCFLGSDGIRLRVGSGLSSRFISYQLQSRRCRSWLIQHASGTTMLTLNQKTLERVPIALPSLTTQENIAGVLGALDDKIAANNTILDTIRELLVSKFEQLGIDSSGEADERSGTVADLMYINPRETVNPAEEAPFLEMKNLPDAAMTVSDWAYRAPKGGAKFRNGDTLLARITPCLENGKVGYVDFLNVGEVGVGSTEFIVMRPRDGVPKALPWLLSKSPKFREYAIKHMAGTSGRQRLSARDIGPYPVTIPSSAQMESFSKLSDHLLKVIHGRVVENRSLAHTRDELLPLLMSGAITVKTAAQIVEKVN